MSVWDLCIESNWGVFRDHFSYGLNNIFMPIGDLG